MFSREMVRNRVGWGGQSNACLPTRYSSLLGVYNLKLLIFIVFAAGCEEMLTVRRANQRSLARKSKTILRPTNFVELLQTATIFPIKKLNTKETKISTFQTNTHFSV